MFNFDGQIVAGVITADGLGQTFNEILQSRRDAKREAGPTEQDYVNLFNAYNQLVARFNRVIENDKIENEKNRQIDLGHAELIAARDQKIMSLVEENNELKYSLGLAKGNEEWLRATLRIAEKKLRDAGLPE